jgi:outer membrane protein assembly factor BamB/thioredoxin-like negative regulator of GroEL
MLGCAVGLLAAGIAWGQAEEGEKTRYVNPFQPAPSDIRRPLTLALEAIQNGDYSDAAYRLGQLLMHESIDDPEAQDYFLVGVEAEEQALVNDRLKARANELIASLPAEGRRAYELHFGDQARAQLDEALAAGDPDKLAEVIRRFFHTRAGNEAALLAGRLYLARGKPMAAALQLQRLTDQSPAAADFEPELSILLATCWLYAEQPDKARHVLLDLKTRAPGASLRVGDRTVAMFSESADPVAWLDELLGDRRAIRDPEIRDWVVYQGNAQRNGRSRGSAPLMSARWLVPTTIEREDEKIISRFSKQYRDEGRPVVPALHPLAVGDTILMRTPHKLLGVDFTSGKRIWVWPPWEDETVDPFVGQLALLQRGLTGMREQELHQRVWEDAAHGQITSDGRSVFLLHELGYAPSSTNRAQQIIIARGGFGLQSPGSPRSSNQLVSLSLARQGAAQWIVGGENGEDEPQLAGAFFLGSPLPLRDRLYAIAEFNGEIRLVVLEGQTGRLIWQQQLAHADAETILVDPMRRLLGATPSYEGGVLLCPTVAGALVAVDISTRSLLWGYRYEQEPTDNRGQQIRFGHIYNRNQNREVGSRWLDTTVTVADGRVLLTAMGTESDTLHCLDLLTGQPVWTPQERGDRLYVACVHAGKVILVGSEQVEALQLADGKPAWPAPVKLDDAPSGRGFYADHYYFVPTAGAELVRIELNAGQIDKRTPTSEVLGNLVCFRDEIISQGSDFLAAYYQAEPLKVHVQQRLEDNPQDVEALARYGEVLLQEGRRDEALEIMRRANLLQPDNDTTRSLMVSTLLDALRDDFAANAQFSSEIEPLIDRPEQRSQYLRLMADGWHATGQLRKAFDAYLELARFQGLLGEDAGVTDRELTRIDRQLDIRSDRWLRARIGTLWQSANDEDRGYMQQAIGRCREQALTSGDVSSLRQFVRIFGSHPTAAEVELQLASRLIETRDWLEAELLLQRLVNATDLPIRSRATAELARLLEHARRMDLAAAWYQKLADEYSDVPCRDGLTGRELCAAAMENSALAEAAELARRGWLYGGAKIEEATDVTNRHPSYRRVYESQIRQRTGPAPAGLSVIYEPQPQNQLLIQDGDGKVLHSVSLGNRRLATTDYNLTHARICGHLILVSMGAELLAIDALQSDQSSSEAILWRRDLVRSGIGAANYQTQVQVQALNHPWGGTRRIFVDAQKHPTGETAFVSDSGVYFFSLRALICADPISGDVIWQRDGLPQGSDVFGDEELIFVVPPDSDTATVYSAVDGRQLDARPVPLLENRWATSGRRVLAWDQQDASAPLRLRLIDAWSGDPLWTEQVPLGTKGTLIDCDEVALLQPDGRLVIRRLDGAEEFIETSLDPEPGLETLYVMRSQARYLVLAGRQVTVEPNSAEARIRSVNFGAPIPLLTGRIYGLDRQTGKPCWDQPASIERYGYHTAQPTELPILLFIRHYTPIVEEGAPRQHTAVLCLDRRDGRVLVEKDDINSLTYTFDVVADRPAQSITIGLSTKPFTITLTDTPADTEPPETAEPAAATAGPEVDG